MTHSRKLFSLILAAAVVPFFASAYAQADTIATLHMDINAITISAVGSTPFSTAFTGALNFSTNPTSSLDMDVENEGVTYTNIGYTGEITGFTGSLDLTAGALSGGTVTVSVATGSDTDTYTYDIVVGSGSCYRSPSPIVFHAMGYSISGDTDNGDFANSDFAGVDVSSWYAEDPNLSGSFFQFHYRPDVTGVDGNGDIDLYVNADITSSGDLPLVPLPSSLLSGLAGFGMLGAYRWHRGRRLKQNT